MIHLIAISAYIHTHIFGVILAVVAAMCVGFVWYGMLFTKTWTHLSKLDHLSDAQKKETMIPGTLATAVMAFVQSALLGRAFEMLYLPSIGYAFLIATLFWIPFTALVLLNMYVWARKPFVLFCIDAGYTLVTMWVLAAVLYVTL